MSTNEAEQREAPPVESVSTEEAPEPVVEEPAATVAESEPATYEPEPLPPGAQIIQKQQGKSTVAKGRYPVVIYKDENGKMQQRAHFTNDPVQTFNQIAAGQEINVPQGTKVHPDIKVTGGKVVGVNRSVNGSVRLIENQEQANAAARDDVSAAMRSEIQRDTPEVKAAKDAARVAVSGVLPEFTDESTFVNQPLLDRIKTIAARVPRLDSIARENLESDILAKLIAVKRAGAFINSQVGETIDEKKLAALAAPEVKGNRQLESLIRNYDATQEGNLSYIQNEVSKAKADTGRSVQTESLDAQESGVTEDVAAPAEEVVEQTELEEATKRLEGIPDKIKETLLSRPDNVTMINGLSDEKLAELKSKLTGAKAERIKAGYRSVRSIMEESDRLGLKDGQPKSILTALQRIADNKNGDNYHPHIVYVARALSKLTDSLSQIQDLRFSTVNALHAASYRASDHSISLNLGTAWGEQQTVGEILVHEVGHALTSIKLNDPQTQYDKALAGEIEGMRSQISDYLSNVRPADAERFAYQLSNADEFVAGVFSNPPFVELLASLPERLVAGTPVSTKSNFFTSLLRKLWNLMLGKSVTPGSPLERAMDAVFSLAETPFTIPTAENVLNWTLGAKTEAAPSSKESLPGEHRELIVEAMRALPAGYTLNTDTSSDSPVWVRRSRPGVIFANPGILAAEVAGMNAGRRTELLRSFIEEEVAHTEDLKELGDDEARRIARELAPETRAWINDLYGQDLNDIETVFEGFRMLRQRMRNGATTEEIRAFAASDPNFARRFLEYLRRMWKRLMANLDQDKTLANIKAVRSLVGGIDTLESLAAGEDDTKLGVSPWAWIRDQVKSTAGTVTSHRTKAPWFATQDENTSYKATGVAFGSGRKNVSIAEAERVKNAVNTAEGRALTVLDRDIKAAAVKTMGSWDAAKALVGEAIGNNENRMDYDQRKQYERDHTVAAKAALATYQSELGAARALENQGDYAGAATLKQAAQSKFKTDVSLAKDDFDHKVQQAEALARQQALAKQAAAMQALPTELREAVQRARDRMDALTTEFINKGYGSDDLRATLSNNLGLYLHRSYSAFDSPHWAKWVMGKDPEAVRLRNKVETLIKTDLTAKKAAELIKANPSLNQQAAIVQAQGLLNDNEIEAKIQELLENSPDEYTSLVQGDGFKNGKPSSVIKRRGEIHPWIQEFWGKHDDPLLNISKSIGLTHAYLAQQSMLRTILNDGVRDGYIFDDVGKAKGLVALKDKTEENMRRYPSLFRKDANGKIIGEWFVSPLVRDAIQDLEPASPGSDDSFVSRAWNVFRALTGYSMAAKTVYSPMALTRDFLSNITLLTIHGHMTPGFAAGTAAWSKSLAANAREVGLDRLLQGILSPVRGKAPVFSQAQMNQLDRLLTRSDELGITGNQMTTGVIKELTKEHSKRFDLRGKDVNRLLKGLSAGLSNVAERFTEARALSDDIPKLVAWVNETLRTAQFHPNMTQAEAEEVAAKKVRMVMPTYSETSDFIKYWRKQPFFSPFVTFSGEIVRTMINTYKLGAQEMKSNSVGEKILGFHRMAMMTAMITVLPAVIQSAVSKFRPEDDPPVKTDELATALPRFVSGWQKENMLLWLGKEGNKHTYLDLSYLAPYDVIHGILTGTARELFTNPDNVTIPGKVSAALQKAFDEATKPVAKEQLLTGAIIDTMRNQREPGDKFGLYNDKLATGWEKWTASLSNIWQQALEPGIVKSARGIMKGLNQEVDGSGRAYETGNEIRSLFGAKTMSQDIPTRLTRNGNGYARDLSDATMYASQPFSSAGTQDDETLIKAFARMNEAKLKVVGEIRKDWLAAQSLGMTAEEATKSLAISHLPKDMLSAAVSNEYVREPLSKQLLEKAAANGQALGQDRMALYRRAVEAYPVKQKVLNF